ncbi:MAG: hypothetical protein R3A10_08180 [Caldilineaceae bacterium]
MTHDMTGYHAFNRIGIDTPAAILEMGFLGRSGTAGGQSPVGRQGRRRQHPLFWKTPETAKSDADFEPQHPHSPMQPPSESDIMSQLPLF